MKKVLAMALVAALSAGAIALAEYHAEYDVYIHVDAPGLDVAAEAVGLDAIGNQLFQAQEGAHESVTHTTGTDVDHYYVWLCIGSSCVPVDPFTVNR